MNDSQACTKCYLKSPHIHFYLYLSETDRGLSVGEAEVFDVCTQRHQFESMPTFISWVNDEWLDVIRTDLGDEVVKRIKANRWT